MLCKAIMKSKKEKAQEREQLITLSNSVLCLVNKYDSLEITRYINCPAISYYSESFIELHF